MLRWKDKKLDDLNASKFSQNWATYTVLLLALGAMTFFGVCDPGSSQFAGQNPLSGGLAATVADEDVSAMDFRRAYQDAYSRYQKQFSENFDPAALQLSRMVMSQLVNDRVVYELATNNGLYASNEEVEKVIADAEIFRDEKGKFSGERFENFLRANRYTEEGFTEEVRRNLTADKFRRFVTDTTYTSKKAAEWQYKLSETKLNVEYLKFDPQAVKVTVSDADVTAYLNGEGKDKVKQYYERNKKEFNQDKKVKASHVLVSFQGARNASGAAATRKKDDAKAMAEKIAAEAKGGADFAALAQKHSDDPSAKGKGGDLGFFTADAMVKEFSDAAFAMKKGEVSGVVESPFGFHVIKMTDVQEPKNVTLEQAGPGIARKLLESEKKPALIKEAADKALVDLKEGKDGKGVAATHGVVWQETGPFALTGGAIPKLGTSKNVKDAVYSLSKSKALYPQVVDAGDSMYILRLKDLSEANVAGLDAKKKHDLAKSTGYMEAYGTYSALASAAQKNFEQKGKIWVNEEFRDLDLNRENRGG